MHRRQFLHHSKLILGITPFLPPLTMMKYSDSPLYPKALQPGDTIGLLCPSSAISRTVWERTLKNMTDMGFKPVYSDNVRVKKGFLAGTDQQRLDDLHTWFADDTVDGIFCVRGGYGSQRLLDQLDMDVIRKNPKVFVGFSDITALHLAIYQQTGLICFHGPNAGANHSPYSLQMFLQLLMGEAGTYSLDNKVPTLDEKNRTASYVVQHGKAKGVLVGGNLTLISTLMGTPFEPDFRDKIVMLEDVGEAPYRIDRMLTQLKLSGKLAAARALVLGIFADCEEKPDHPDFPDTLSLKEVLTERLYDLGIPVIVGLPFGHIADNAIWPVGGEAELDTTTGQLRLISKIFK